MSNSLCITLEQLGAPPREFWENELEVFIDPILRKATDAEAITCWLASRHGPERMILHRLASEIPPRIKERCGRMGLVPYMLVHEFMKHKSKPAAIEHAQRVLPSPLLELCRTKEGDLNANAVCFAMYQHDYTQLPIVLCLDKIYRSGFAQMRLLQNIRRPRQDLVEFLIPKTVVPILQTLDAGEHPCELKQILHNGNRHTVCVRRAERPDRILCNGRIVHGYHPEWIILEFAESAKQVRIASASNGPPLEIANRIATAYYGKPCEYEIENLVTYRQQLCLFLRRLQAGQDPELRLIELERLNSPLVGSPYVIIGHAQSIGAAIGHFEYAIGPLLADADVEQVAGITTVFRGKQVTFSFERAEPATNHFVVRCSDQRLTPSERHELEEHLKVTYAIVTQSTEMRIRGAA